MGGLGCKFVSCIYVWKDAHPSSLAFIPRLNHHKILTSTRASVSVDRSKTSSPWNCPVGSRTKFPRRLITTCLENSLRHKPLGFWVGSRVNLAAQGQMHGLIHLNEQMEELMQSTNLAKRASCDSKNHHSNSLGRLHRL